MMRCSLETSGQEEEGLFTKGRWTEAIVDKRHPNQDGRGESGDPEGGR